MAVNRVTVGIMQNPSGLWLAQITGWRVEHSVAWTTQRALTITDPTSIRELLAEVGSALVREFGGCAEPAGDLPAIQRGQTSE